MGEMDAESDCERDSHESEDNGEVGNKETLAVLSPGSHSAWVELSLKKNKGFDHLQMEIYFLLRVHRPRCFRTS
jgi:hypothetical protein